MGYAPRKQAYYFDNNYAWLDTPNLFLDLTDPCQSRSIESLYGRYTNLSLPDLSNVYLGLASNIEFMDYSEPSVKGSNQYFDACAAQFNVSVGTPEGSGKLAKCQFLKWLNDGYSSKLGFGGVFWFYRPNRSGSIADDFCNLTEVITIASNFHEFQTSTPPPASAPTRPPVSPPIEPGHCSRVGPWQVTFCKWCRDSVIKISRSIANHI